MNAIYEPKGKAREYSELACNLYQGCSHGCTYCYAPSILHMTRKEFHGEVKPRVGILNALEKDCKKMAGDPRPVLLCFTCDPYQPMEADRQVTRLALEILGRHDMKISVLTKSALAERDFDIFQKYDVDFGMTIICWDGSIMRGLEPGASLILDRMNAIRKAKQWGIRTWVSIEPVIYPVPAVALVENLYKSVDRWKVGKLNYDKRREEEIDWPEFLDEMLLVLNAHGAEYYIKDDLWALRSDDCEYPKEMP